MDTKSDIIAPLPIKPIETVHTDASVVVCEGNNPVLGHPRVFLKLKDGHVTCPYCSKFFTSSPVSKNS